MEIEAFDNWFMNEYESAYSDNYKELWNKEYPSDLLNLTKDPHRKQYSQDLIVEYQELLSQIKAMGEHEKTQRVYGN